MNLSFLQAEKTPNLKLGLSDISFLQKARESVDEILGFVEVGMPTKDIDIDKLKENISEGFIKIAQFGIDRSVESLQARGELPDAIDGDQFKIKSISDYTKEFALKDFLVNIEDDNGLVDALMLDECKHFMIQNAIDYTDSKIESIAGSLYEKNKDSVSLMLVKSLSETEVPGEPKKSFMILDLRDRHMSVQDLNYVKDHLDKHEIKAVSVILPKNTDETLTNWYKSSLQTKGCNFYPMKEESLSNMKSDQQARIIESILRKNTVVVGYSEDSRKELLDHLTDLTKQP